MILSYTVSKLARFLRHRVAAAAAKLITDTYSEDVHFTDVHLVVGERKLNNDVSEGLYVVRTGD